MRGHLCPSRHMHFGGFMDSCISAICSHLGFIRIFSISGLSHPRLLAMPGYHVVAAGMACADGGTIVKSSTRPLRMASYKWTRPVQAMDLPMDGLSQIPGIVEQGYDELLAELF